MQACAEAVPFFSFLAATPLPVSFYTVRFGNGNNNSKRTNDVPVQRAQRPCSYAPVLDKQNEQSRRALRAPRRCYARDGGVMFDSERRSTRCCAFDVCCARWRAK